MQFRYFSYNKRSNERCKNTIPSLWHCYQQTHTHVHIPGKKQTMTASARYFEARFSLLAVSKSSLQAFTTFVLNLSGWEWQRQLCMYRQPTTCTRCNTRRPVATRLNRGLTWTAAELWQSWGWRCQWTARDLRKTGWIFCPQFHNACFFSWLSKRAKSMWRYGMRLVVTALHRGWRRFCWVWRAELSAMTGSGARRWCKLAPVTWHFRTLVTVCCKTC